MQFLHHFIGLACHLDFTFTSIWLSSSENVLADAASHFLYARLFQLAPYLNKQPSLKLLWIGGISDMHSSPKLLHSTSGMGLHPAHGQPTSLVKSSSSNISSSIFLQTKMVPYSLHPSKPLCNGLHPLATAFSPKPSKLISPMSDQCILTSVYPSLPQTPPSSSASFAESRNFIGNVITSQGNQLLSVSSPTSSLISTQRKLGTAPFMQHVASPMLASSAAENSHWNLPSLTSHLKPSSLQPQSSSSHHMKMQNLSQFSSQLLNRPVPQRCYHSTCLHSRQGNLSSCNTQAAFPRFSHCRPGETTLPSPGPPFQVTLPKFLHFYHLQSP